VLKIFVVNYDELNPRRSIEQIADDIYNSFLTADQAMLEEMGTELRARLPYKDEYEIEFADTAQSSSRACLINNIRKCKADLLVTYNLAGFELSTLMDSLGYNLVDCRQFHFVMKKELLQSEYMKKEKSINMFFFYEIQ